MEYPKYLKGAFSLVKVIDPKYSITVWYFENCPGTEIRSTPTAAIYERADQYRLSNEQEFMETYNLAQAQLTRSMPPVDNVALQVLADLVKWENENSAASFLPNDIIERANFIISHQKPA